MQPNKKITDDLEYLSQLGYNSFPDAEKDIEELKQKARMRFGSNSGMSSNLVALLIGLFIGITVFFTIYNTPLLFPSHTEVTNNNALKNPSKNLSLDTIQIMAQLPKVKHTLTEKFIEPIESDSAVNSETLNPIDTKQLTIGNEHATELKYSPNAAIVYLHDLKIANYQTYYFTSQKMIIVHQHLNADKANRVENPSLANIPHRDQYLHEVIDEAMKLFKKQKYNECLSLLNTVSEFSKNDVNCDFYKGMCYYYMQNYELAYKQLKLARANTINVFMEESTYYLALSALKTDRGDEAQKLLIEIVGNNDFYAKKAKELLNK